MRVLRSLLQSAQFYTTENGQVLSLESEEFQEASAALKIASFTRSEGWGDQVPLNQGLLTASSLLIKPALVPVFSK